MPFQGSKDWFDDEEEKKPKRIRKNHPISPLARPKWLEDLTEIEKENIKSKK